MKFEEHKTRIYPWIKVTTESDGTGMSLEVTDANAPLMRQWMADLIVTYAVDMGDRFELLQNRDLPAGMTMQELDQLAIENLARDVSYQFVQTGFGGHGLIAGGDHEAGALAWPGLWEWCAAQLNDDLVVAVPAKDLVMMAPASDPAIIGGLKGIVNQIFQSGNRLLTRQLFHYNRTTQKWSLFQD